MAEYEEDIFRGLQRVKERIPEKEEVELQDLKLIILSDQHRSQGDSADDFKMCKPAYHAALGYYLESGYTLYLLGDVEELWESRPKNITGEYQDTLKLEKSFVEKGKYKRFWGNHDDDWQYPRKFSRYLKKYIAKDGEDALAYEGHVISVHHRGKKLGELLFLHGHQGTFDADRFARLSKIVVRYIWRPFQRLTKIKSTTPATDFQLRLKHELAMHNWASQHKGLILISGHTHHPAFSSESHESFLKNGIASLKQKLKKKKDTSKIKKIQAEIEAKSARLDLVLAKSNGVILDIPEEKKPCYFNTGCCSFSDGNITGIEIDQGIIRLVRWPDDQGNPKKKVLREEQLIQIFKRCN
jgi:UDP-2,3-diacylglucosamine pyrophosphatase LpxH